MHIEIEAKLKVGSLPAVVKKLKAAGARFVGKHIQTDTYFDDGKSSLRKSDSALRVRRQLIGRKEQVIVAFKGPKRKGRFKQRQEIQFEVSDARLAEMLLAAIGYKKALVFQKKRDVWLLGGCEVALDELPLLGSFVEIEGPDEKKIAAVQKKLGLSDLPHIADSYAVLMTKQLRRHGRKNNRVFF
ncbi:MAG: class IV adenylate cyclase [Sedimentisphaerales bacterium]|jgi:adenylate cyclase class 2